MRYLKQIITSVIAISLISSTMFGATRTLRSTSGEIRPLDTDEGPEITLDPQRLPFGEVAVGEQIDRMLKITNTGDEDLVISVVEIDNEAFLDEFAGGEVILPPGEAYELVVIFAPPEIAEYEGILTITSNDAENGELHVPLMGAGVEEPSPPAIVTLPEEVEFGEVMIGDHANANLTVSNVGGEVLIISDVVSDNEAFTTDFNAEIVLWSGESHDIAVTFSPEAAELYQGALVITSNDPENEQLEVSVTGTGTEFERQVVTLSYEDPNPENLALFYSLPDNFGTGDRHCAVHFTPPFDPCYLLAMEVALFDMDSNDAYGPMGEPGVRVIVWHNGVDDTPGDSITFMDVPFEELVFSPDGDLEFNVIDLSELDISFINEIDFHISVDEIDPDNEDDDTLAIFVDTGEFADVSRSRLFGGNEEDWLTLEEIFGAPHNFAIHAVVTDALGAVEVLKPAQPPRTALLSAIYPNPFNNQAELTFRVPIGVPYRLQLQDLTGRRIEEIKHGIGIGESKTILKTNGIPAGAYYVKLITPNNAVMRQVLYLK